MQQVSMELSRDELDLIQTALFCFMEDRCIRDEQKTDVRELLVRIAVELEKTKV